MNDLTDDEAALLYHVQRFGSDGYPIQKLAGNKWIIRQWQSWSGFPAVFKTKKAATARFEQWVSLALERWSDMKSRKPSLIMTAVGIRE